MKKICTTVTLLLVALLLLSSCVYAENEAAPVLELNGYEFTIEKNKSVKLTYTLANTGDLGKAKITWSSSDKKIATVADGSVTGVAGGTAEITCTCTFKDQTILEKKCIVTVTERVTSITLPAKLDVDIGFPSEPVQYQIKPATATCQDVIWSSSDEEIATVDENGVIIGLKTGKVTITATSAETTDKPKFAKLTVNILKPVEKIELSQAEETVGKGKSITLTAAVYPEDASNKKVTWMTSDKKIATVTNGKITGVNGGNAVITCLIANANGDEISASCNIRVITSITSISASKTQITVNAGMKSEQMVIKYSPADATYKQVVWHSENEEIAVVDENGIITGVKPGKTKVIAVTDDPTLTTAKQCVINVTVNRGAESITISGGDTVAKGKTMKLTADVFPADTTNKKVIWTSKNPNIATINATGTVTPKATGKCTVTAEAADGSGVQASYTFQVIQAVTGVSLSKKQLVIFQNGSGRISATVSPSDATNKKVVWTTSDSWVATVDSNGNVTGKHEGKATITCTAADGSKKYATATVYVEPSVPLTLESIGTGIYRADLLGMTVKNHCQKTSIVNFDFDMKIENFYGMSYSGSYNLGDDSSIPAGQTKTIKRTAGGVGSAHKITITITGVTLKDGTYYSIPKNLRDTWTFTVH